MLPAGVIVSSPKARGRAVDLFHIADGAEPVLAPCDRVEPVPVVTADPSLLQPTIADTPVTVKKSKSVICPREDPCTKE